MMITDTDGGEIMKNYISARRPSLMGRRGENLAFTWLKTPREIGEGEEGDFLRGH